MKIRLPAQYAIRHNGEQVRWVSFPPGVSFELREKFSADCLVAKHRAEAFLETPGTDSRYELYKISLTGIREE